MSDSKQPGHFTVDEQNMFLFFNCPCGCNIKGAVKIYRDNDIKPAGMSWSWNGDVRRPSLNPSIKRHIACNWHGFLTGGEWTGVQTDGAPNSPNVYKATPT